MVREVVSVGFLLMEESPTLLGHLIGTVLVRNGGEALSHVLRMSGQGPRADMLAEALNSTERAVHRPHPGPQVRQLHTLYTRSRTGSIFDLVSKCEHGPYEHSHG